MERSPVVEAARQFLPVIWLGVPPIDQALLSARDGPVHAFRESILRAVAVIIACLLAGASTGCGPTRCSVAGAEWPDHVGQWLPGPTGRPAHLSLRMDKDGTIAWDGSGLGLGGNAERVSITELREILEITGSMSPTPYIVVDVSEDAPCDRVRALSRELEGVPACRKGGCLESSAWENYQA